MSLAEPAAERPFGEGFLRLLGPRPGRVEFATRLALICALTTLVVEIYQTPDPALTVYLVFFVNKPDRMESIVLSVVLAVLMTVIIGLTILMSIAVIDAPFWRVALMTALSLGFLFAAFASKLRPLAGTIMLIVGYALDLLGTAHLGEIATRGLLYAWLFVAIPAGVSVIVNLAIAPPPRRLAERALAERLRVAAAMLRAPGERTRRAFTEVLPEGMGEILTWLKLAGLEKTSPAKDLAALRQAANSTAAILTWVEVVSRDTGRLPARPAQQVANALEGMAGILHRGGYPVEITLDAHDDEVLSARSAELWADITNLLAHFAEPPPDSSPAPSAPGRPRFFLPDAFTNPEYVRYAFKTTAAAMFCYVMYSLLNWPSIHTCFITCYIVALGSAAETVEKLSLRIVGCTLGAAAGIASIVFVTPSLTSIEALLTLVFLGALASAWVAAGSPRVSYAGFQMAFAFFVCAIQGASPAFDMVTARDRIIGILLGNLVAYIVFTRAWPMSVAKRVDPAIAAVLRTLSAMGTAANTAARHSLALQAQGALGTIGEDIHLARYEPVQIRPNERWLCTRREALAEIGALQGPLLMNASREPVRAAEVADRLNRIAASLTSAETGAETRVVTPTQTAHDKKDAARARSDDTIGQHLDRLGKALGLNHSCSGDDAEVTSRAAL